MSLIEIPWEKRALGVEAFQVDFDKMPNLFSLNDAINKKVEQYKKIFIQAFVAKDQFSLLPGLNKLGFYAVETRLVSYLPFNKCPMLAGFYEDPDNYLPPRHSGAIKIKKINYTSDAEKARIKEIAIESFSDDRFHMDPLCDRSKARMRFSYWIDDLLNQQGVVVYLFFLNHNIVYFNIRKKRKLILGSFSKKYVNYGYGRYCWLTCFQDMVNEGLRSMDTVISAYNISVLNSYVALGLKIRKSVMVLHRW